ncbi:MAG: C39 family peptidase [Candidatus Saccharimonas sp.]
MAKVQVDDPRSIQDAYDNEFDGIAQAHYDREFASMVDAEKNGADDPSYGKDSDDPSTDVNQSSNNISDKETAGAGDTPSWKLNRDTPTESSGEELSSRDKAVKLLKKGGPSAIIVAFLLGGGSILGGFLGAGSLLVSLAENAVGTNDAASTSMEKRFIKVFANSTDPANNELCKSSVKSIRCKMGRISNNAIKSLNKRGVIAVVDGQDYEGKRTGYPSKNPESYKFPDGRGGHVNVPAGELKNFLTDPSNREMASKVLGVRGAFNMRYKAWASKVIDKKFYKKFGLKRDGGVADGSGIGGEEDPNERHKSMLAKLREKIPAIDKVAGVNEFPKRMSEKMQGHVKRAGRAGIAYTLAVSSCIAVKLPGYIAAGIAGLQLVQLLPYGMDLILSPSSKQKAATIGSGFTTDDATKIGTIATEKDANGKAMLDSAILLAAIGVNKGAPAMSSKYTPGYAITKNGIVKAAGEASQASKGACNAIMSPAAMYTAMAVEGAVTVASNVTIIGGILKLAAGFAITEIASQLMKSFGEEAAKAAIEEVAKNDNLPKAVGEELGDAVGISLVSFFSAGGMATGLPGLKESQLGEFNAMKQETENFQREMDIASLSPFDTSSRYTFLGSIKYNTQMAMLANGGYTSNSILSTLTSIASLPMAALSSKASAANYYDNTDACKYAKTLELETENPEDTPAINLAGMPCTGITRQQANMETTEAMRLLSEEGWIDLDKEGIQDGATMDEMLSSGFIVNDTPLAEFIKSCSDASTGEYMVGAAGCTVGSPKTGYIDLGSGCLQKYDDKGKPIPGEVVCSTDQDKELPDVKNPASLAAMSTFLIDYRISQAVSGEDDQENIGSDDTPTPTGPSTPAGDFTFYTQGGDAPWAQKIYTDDTYAMQGCGPTAAAMVIATFKDKSVTPDMVGDWMKARSGIPYHGERLPEVFANWGLQSEVFPAGSSGAEDKILQALRDGKLVVVSGKGGTPFTSGGHFIVLRGLEGDKILIGDSASKSNNTVAFDQATIFNQYHNAVNIISKP